MSPGSILIALELHRDVDHVMNCGGLKMFVGRGLMFHDPSVQPPLVLLFVELRMWFFETENLIDEIRQVM